MAADPVAVHGEVVDSVAVHCGAANPAGKIGLLLLVSVSDVCVFVKPLA